MVKFGSLSTVDLEAWKREGYPSNPGKGLHRRDTTCLSEDSLRITIAPICTHHVSISVFIGLLLSYIAFQPMVRESYHVWMVEWSLLRKAGWTGQVSGSRPVLNSKAKVQREGLEVTIERPIDSYTTEYSITPP